MSGPNWSRRTRLAASIFNLDLELAWRPPAPIEPPDADPLGARSVLIVGPSGAGKSLLLRSLAGRARSGGVRVIDARAIALPDRPPVDLLRAEPLRDALRLLARAGLGEAHCFVRPASCLSDGQRERLRIALALARALSPTATRPRSNPRAVLLVFDEFLSHLDRPTARAVAASLRSILRTHDSIRLLGATAHEDLADHLSPELLVALSLDGGAKVRRSSSSPSGGGPSALVVREGDFDDYLALSRFHYRSGPPATRRRVLVADLPECARVGALVVSSPSLNADWRALAWPATFGAGPRSRVAAAALVNRELRTISRVVVDPRFRGLSIGTSLVRAYLADPLTPGTEALAAMGEACRFFADAGMTEWRLGPSRRDARLLDALAGAGVRPHDLPLPSRAFRRALASLGEEPLRRALLRWANDSRATRRALDGDPSTLTLFRLACRSVRERRFVYTHSRDAGLTGAPCVNDPSADERSTLSSTAAPPRPTRSRSGSGASSRSSPPARPSSQGTPRPSTT